MSKSFSNSSSAILHERSYFILAFVSLDWGPKVAQKETKSDLEIGLGLELDLVQLRNWTQSRVRRGLIQVELSPV